MTTNNIREGALFKQSRHLRLLRKRWTVLQQRYSHFSNTQYYLCTFRKEKIYESPTESIPINQGTQIGIHTDEYDENNLMFYVKNKKDGHLFLFEAQSTQDRNQWIQQIQHIQSQITV